MPTIHTTATRRAFSLVELITVVTIIGVVIAILVPALGGARNIAKKTATTVKTLPKLL
jgi:prepilin-type N-terminal cleavage/methylation domain-containing protein